MLGAINRDGRALRADTYHDRPQASCVLARRLGKLKPLVIRQAQDFRHHAKNHAVHAAAENPFDLFGERAFIETIVIIKRSLQDWQYTS
jgi:hypothetical protein